MSRVTLDNLSLDEYHLTDRVKRLREAYFQAMPEVCVERPRLLTQYLKTADLFGKDRISVLQAAQAYRYVLERRTPIVKHTSYYAKGIVPRPLEDSSPFAGTTTSKFKGVPLYPEFLALTLWPELWTIGHRSTNPFVLSARDAKELNESIFPCWVDFNITELTRQRMYADNRHRLPEDRTDPEKLKATPLLELHDLMVFFLASKFQCVSHTVPDFSVALSRGLRGIVQDAQSHLSSATDDDERQLYLAMVEAMEGVVAYGRALSAEANRLASACRDETEKNRLRELAEVHARVPEQPARTFREALTTVWVCWTACHLENANTGLSLGRLDQVLYPYYRRDVDAGRLSVGDAIELICYFWLKIGDHVPSIPETGEKLFGGTGSNQAITIGGVDKDGMDAVNDLTYVMLRATELMKLRDPNLNARYHAGVNSPAYLRRLCEVNVNTGATPALHNDIPTIAALCRRGDDISHARDYCVIGCVEPCSNGRAYGHTGAILVNLAAALELVLFNGRHRHTGMGRLISVETGDPCAFADYDAFKRAFETQTKWLIRQATDLNNYCGRIHQLYHPTPILSALFEGPMKKGKDLAFGGAEINSSGMAIIGLADVADSLSAIERAVFDRQQPTMGELLAALNNDFAGSEALQKRLANPDKTPKWGNDDSDADRNVAWIVRLMDEVVSGIANYRDGHYRVGYWSMTCHTGFGMLTGALPSGRRAHENFSSGFTPESGKTPCLTKTINSVANLPSIHINNGVAFNLKYTPEVRPQMLDDFVASVATYFGDAESPGGLEVQFNVLSHDMLVKAAACKDPEKDPVFRELLVRVSGYTAYFKDLNPQMQKEVIERSEYLLKTGQQQTFGSWSLPTHDSPTSRETTGIAETAS